MERGGSAVSAARRPDDASVRILFAPSNKSPHAPPRKQDTYLQSCTKIRSIYKRRKTGKATTTATGKRMPLAFLLFCPACSLDIFPNAAQCKKTQRYKGSFARPRRPSKRHASSKCHKARISDQPRFRPCTFDTPRGCHLFQPRPPSRRCLGW